MKKVRHGYHRVKKEAPEPLAGTSSASKPPEEKELAYYIHDRVELMHQVFSVLRGREIRSMAPECIRNLSVGDLQELCLEELLGISSKRLCAILDGAEPPSDTSSSDSDIDKVECVSLDSISSIEELSSGGEPSRKKRKCKRKEGKTKKTPRAKSRQKDAAKPSVGSAGKEKEAGDDTKAAERAGMTVLELLELQARARAIRAQLVMEHSKKGRATDAPAESLAGGSDSEDGVEIKEEPAEVVELISSDEERKPDKGRLDDSIARASESSTPQSTITKKNDLTIIVPAAQVHRKVKLNRNKHKAGVDKSGEETNQKEIQQQTPSKQKENNDKQTVINTQPTTVNRTLVNDNQNQVTNKMVTAQKSKLSQYIEKKKKFKRKKESKRKQSTGEGSDHDEITLQLSDTEKMDLLEGLDRKNYDNVSSSSADSSQSSYEESEESEEEKEPEKPREPRIPESHSEVTQIHSEKSFNDCKNSEQNEKNTKNSEQTQEITKNGEQNENKIKNTEHSNNITKHSVLNENNTENANASKVIEEKIEVDKLLSDKTEVIINYNEMQSLSNEHCTSDSQKETPEETLSIPSSRDLIIDVNQDKIEKTIEITSIEDIPVQEDILERTISDRELIIEDKSERIEESTCLSSKEISIDMQNLNEINCLDKSPEVRVPAKEMLHERKNSEEKEDICKTSNENSSDKFVQHKESTENNKDTKNDTPENISKNEMSEGELSDRESSEVEIFEKQEEVVCISDEETPKKKKKEKKKKEKKSKKEKKTKRKSDFCEVADQNFFNQSSSDDEIEKSEQNNLISKKVCISPSVEKDSDGEDIYEIFEISDDSSCYEVEGTVLSKEPTSEEIAALSAKIDTEIEREDIITEEQIQILENKEKPKEAENIDDVSWKDRWLDSTKVKKVLTTSNILNAMRKKNKELKKKLEESKKTEKEPKKPEETAKEIDVIEGSIEHFNTLQGSTTYVDPVKDTANESNDGGKEENENEKGESEKGNLDKEMKKDAKQLLKMYKRLLKFNNEKTKDPNRVKKKKSKKQKKNKEKTQ